RASALRPTFSTTSSSTWFPYYSGMAFDSSASRGATRSTSSWREPCERDRWRTYDSRSWGRFARVRPLPLAEVAVERDFGQGALEHGQLLVVQLGDEQLCNPPRVNRRRLHQPRHARIGKRDHDATCI